MALSDLDPVPGTHGASTPAPSSAPAPPLHPDLPARWPAVVRAELLHRHASLVETVADLPADRVLDLSLPAGRHVLAEAIAAGGLPVPADVTPAGGESDGRFDAVLSVGGLTRFADLGAAVAAAVSLLSPTGQLLAVEPDHRPGILGLAVSSAGALLPPARGVHLARDVPATVRSVGLTITDIRRFELSTLVWPLRRFVSLRAMRISGDGTLEREDAS